MLAIQQRWLEYYLIWLEYYWIKTWRACFTWKFNPQFTKKTSTLRNLDTFQDFERKIFLEQKNNLALMCQCIVIKLSGCATIIIHYQVWILLLTNAFITYLSNKVNQDISLFWEKNHSSDNSCKKRNSSLNLDFQDTLWTGIFLTHCEIQLGPLMIQCVHWLFKMCNNKKTDLRFLWPNDLVCINYSKVATTTKIYFRFYVTFLSGV